MNYWRIGSFFCVVLFWCTGATAAPFSMDKEGTLPSGLAYQLKVAEAAYIHTDDTPPDDGSMWGIDGGYPANVVKLFALTLAGKQVQIPRKFYADISNLLRVDITEVPGGVSLKVIGGDAAGSYSATYLIKRNRLVERTVRHGEFPEELVEKTVLTDGLWDHPEKY